MDLSRNLLKAFSDISNPKQEKKETYLYATAKVDSDGNKSVRVDGSTVDTPVESTAEIKDGERVLVTISNNRAVVMGNMSSPAARVGTVEEVKEVATNADTKAVEAKKVANDAAKQATNFIGYTDEEGLLLGYKGDGEWKGFRSQLLSNQFNILDEEGISQTLIGPGIARIGTAAGNNVFVDSESVNICNGTSVLASFDKNEIKLDVNPYGFANMSLISDNTTSTINMCYDAVSFKATINEDDSATLDLKTTGDFYIYAPGATRLGSSREHWDDYYEGYTTSYLYQSADIDEPYVEMFIDVHKNFYSGNKILDQASFILKPTEAKIAIGYADEITCTFSIFEGISLQSVPSSGPITLNKVTINATDRLMKATLPSGGYWGMVAPSGRDDVWIRTTSSGILPYAKSNTTKLGAVEWPFSEMHFTKAFGYTGLYTGKKTSSDDGVTGAALVSGGRLFLQNTTANPYIGFSGNGDNGYKAYISYSIETKYLQFGGAAQFSFLGSNLYCNQRIRAAGIITSGYGAGYDVDAGFYVPYKDGENHGAVYRNTDGLTTYFGWVGSSTYASVSVLRGRTVKYTNSNGTTTLSDERLKKDFTSLDRWDTFFDTIEPCAFKMKTGSSGRYHIGFKAQQIEEALIQNGLSTQDFAGFIRMPYTVDPEDPETSAAYEAAGIKPGDDELGLLYSEFTALNTYEIQKLKKRIDELEALIKEKNNEK